MSLGPTSTRVGRLRTGLIVLFRVQIYAHTTIGTYEKELEGCGYLAESELENRN